jgi:hypothetical protein
VTVVVPRYRPSPDLAYFQRHGYLVLQGFFARAAVAAAQGALEQLAGELVEQYARRGEVGATFPEEPFETRLAKVFAERPEAAPTMLRPELHLGPLFHLFFDAALLDLVEQLLGPEIRLYPNYTARPKLPDHVPTEVLWHQDGGYTDRGNSSAVAELRMVNAWTPLVLATTHNGCMQFVPGSHRRGVVPHVKRTHYLEIEGTVLDDALRAGVVDIEAQPGDLVLFHNLLFHRGQPNRSHGVRWSLDWRYQDLTQSTLRVQEGHVARSRVHPELAVDGPDDWSRRSFR